MIMISSYTDAAIGKAGGGVGVVVRGYVEGNKDDSFYHEAYLPLPINVGQLGAELFGILTGVEQVACVAKSYGLKPTDFYLKIFTDSEAAVWAIHNGLEVDSASTRTLVKRVVRTVAGNYNKPPGGGAEYVLITKKKSGNARDAACMAQAHHLSRTARTLASDLLKR